MNGPDHTQLHSAVKSNDLEAAQLLLNERVIIHFKDETGLTPLHILLQKRLELFDSLHSKENEEFSHFALSPEGYKSLSEPGAEDDESLMSLYKADQKRRKKFRREKEESLDVIRKQLDHNERFIDMLLKHKSSDHSCAEDAKLLNLCAACTLTNSSIAESIADQVDDINQCLNENSPVYVGYTALHFASLCNTNTVKILVAKGADLQLQDAKAVSSLDTCIKLYSTEEMQSIFHAASSWKNILFSDGKTRLMDYISCLHSPDDHKGFLQHLGKDIAVPLSENSPLWPGSTVLHVAVVLLPESNIEMFKDILDLNTDLVTVQDSHKSTPCHLAFRRNKLKLLELLMKHQKKAVNPVDADRLSHLHIAAAVNNQPLVRRILKNEANFDVAYRGQPLSSVRAGYTPLHTAAHTKHAVVARLLLERGSNLLATDSRGFTAVHLLFGRNYTEKTAAIVFASPQLKERVAESSGLSHLHVAVWKDKPQAIERLLDLGADIDAPISELDDEELAKFNGCRPIHVAMMGYRLIPAYEVLLRRGADILASKLDGGGGTSALAEALTGKYEDCYIAPIVESIWSSRELQRRIEEQMGMTRLHVACYDLDADRIEDLLEKADVDVNARIRDDSSIWPGFTPLHVLVAAGLNLQHAKLTQERADSWCDTLLRRGADVTVTDAEGNTPVLLALKARIAENGIARAKFLMKHQSDFTVNPANKAGTSHFHVACLLNEVEAAQKYLNEIADLDVNRAIDASTNNGRFAGQTPLLMALTPRAKKNHDPRSQIKVVNLLLKHDADARAADAFGCTALHKLAACDLTRKELLPKILIDNADINRQANDGKTPMEVLLSDGAGSAEVKYFVKRGGRLNSYNPVSGVGYMALVFRSTKYLNSVDTAKIIRMMLDSPDILEVSDTGRNAIHNAVANFADSSILWTYNYIGDVGLIEQLVALGCDILQQDTQGKTALHMAVDFQNNDAIEALLECGADINAVDSVGKSPFSYASEPRKVKRAWESIDSNEPICMALVAHLLLLKLVGLRVSELNAKLLSEVMSEREDDISSDIEFEQYVLESQLRAAAEIVLCNSGLTLRDFLCRVNSYWSLKQTDRDAVDLFFETNDLERFPHLKGLFRLQYRNALQRPALIGPTVEAFRELLGFAFPDLCIEIVLLHLTNADLKNITAAAALPVDLFYS